ncbi:MAG: leucyl aminopeptidase [Bryobacteraceae bacterium]|nr:leucyl aminopeptidase [Bryobacteraceae bacterium]
METKIAFTPFETIDADALVLIAFEQTAQSHSWIAELVDTGEFAGKLLDSVILHHPNGIAAKRLVAVGGGKADRFTPTEMRQVAGAMVRLLKGKKMRKIAIVLSEAFQYPEYVAAAVGGAILGEWEPDLHKSKKEASGIDEFTVVCPGGVTELADSFTRGQVIAVAQNFARDLGNEPPNILTPTVLARRAAQMAAETGLGCDILDQDRMRQLGMGALLGVAQGSAEPPHLIVLTYTPPVPAGGVHLALVGKAVTFDTGGISIKPSEKMELMKFDMCGGAAVLGAMQAIASLKPSIAVTAYIPTVENMPGGKAQRPGDIVTSLSGKTIEILNTDAEGRLIMADAITYAKRQGATHLIDASTLTGAIVVALGTVNSGVFSNHELFQSRLLDSARMQGEKMWPMPMDDDYKESLKTVYADLPNIGSRGGGSITAAKFLEAFAEETPWIHLDIAGTAWIDEAKPYMAKGPTGVALRTFVHLAQNWE